MRKLLSLVGLLAIVVVAAELAAPSWVAARAEAAVAEETRQRVTVDVEVSGPPLLVPVAIDGEVDSWTMQVSQVAGQTVPVDVVVELDEVQLDRGRLLRGDVTVTGVERARVTVQVDLSGALPEALQPMAGRLAEVGLPRLLGALGEGTVEQQGGALVLGELSLPLVEGSCAVTGDDSVVTATCDLSEVPPILLRAFA